MGVPMDQVRGQFVRRSGAGGLAADRLAHQPHRGVREGHAAQIDQLPIGSGHPPRALPHLEERVGVNAPALGMRVLEVPEPLLMVAQGHVCLGLPRLRAAPLPRQKAFLVDRHVVGNQRLGSSSEGVRPIMARHAVPRPPVAQLYHPLELALRAVTGQPRQDLGAIGMSGAVMEVGDGEDFLGP